MARLTRSEIEALLAETTGQLLWEQEHRPILLVIGSSAPGGISEASRRNQIIAQRKVQRLLARWAIIRFHRDPQLIRLRDCPIVGAFRHR